MKTLLKLSAGAVTTLALAGTAQAGCGSSLYCGSSSTGHSTLPPLSSYFSQSSGHAHTASHHASHHSTQSVVSFTGSRPSGLNLSAGESLQQTSCPVTVDAPSTAKVLGCYSVVRQYTAPVANTTYYRVVRPIIYVRYPVPVPVPYTVTVPTISPCGVAYGGGSRYGYSHSYGGSRYGYNYSYGGCR